MIADPSLQRRMKRPSRIQSKNGLESYTYDLRHSLQNEKPADKFEPDKKKLVDQAGRELVGGVERHRGHWREVYNLVLNPFAAAMRFYLRPSRWAVQPRPFRLRGMHARLLISRRH